ncbi:MAG: UbiX family flavin prenyltransferase [Armatimonadetes bacterium]|nr:UbiX family flavin prenyltransferase [Armatimonadota bacterium]
MLPPRRLVVAVSGASGSRYAALFLQQAVRLVPEVAVVLSKIAPRVIVHELGLQPSRSFEPTMMLDGVAVPEGHRLTAYGLMDFNAPFASGSNAYDAMVIVPCSQGLIGHLVAGLADTLITRAADVCLKERRPLIVVPREAPLSLIHLRNWTALTECGGTVLPACPSFYQRPQSLDEAMLSVVDRILAHLELTRPGAYHWGEETD